MLLALAMGTIGFGGMFAVYSYFSAAYLATTHAPEWGVSVILVVFGLGITAGNYLAGLAAGWTNPLRRRRQCRSYSALHRPSMRCRSAMSG